MKEYKNLTFSRLVKLLNDWKKSAEKSLEIRGIHEKYWEGQLSIINQLLQIFEIFK